MTGAAVASAAVGTASLIGGKNAADNAEDASQRAITQANELNATLTSLGEQGVDFAQGLMDDWEGTFGGIQDNLSEYYNNLDPDKFATQSKASFQAELDKSTNQFNETMAATGLQSAGMKQQAAQEASFKSAEGNAAIDIAAPEVVNQMQQGFLNSGEGQRNQATNAYSNALTNQGSLATTGANAVMNAQNNLTDQYSQSSAGYMGASGSAFGSAIGLGINAGGNKRPKTPTQRPLEGPLRPGGGF